MKKDYTDGNLASDVSTRCSGRPQRMKTGVKTRYFIGCMYLRAWLLIIWRVIM